MLIIQLICLVQIVVVESSTMMNFQQQRILHTRRNVYRNKMEDNTSQKKNKNHYNNKRHHRRYLMDDGMNSPTISPTRSPTTPKPITSNPTISPTTSKTNDLGFSVPSIVQNLPTFMNNIPTAVDIILDLYLQQPSTTDFSPATPTVRFPYSYPVTASVPVIATTPSVSGTTYTLAPIVPTPSASNDVPIPTPSSDSTPSKVVNILPSSSTDSTPVASPITVINVLPSSSTTPAPTITNMNAPASQASDGTVSAPVAVQVIAPTTPAPVPVPIAPVPVYILPPSYVVVQQPTLKPTPQPQLNFNLPPYLMIAFKPTPSPAGNFWLPPYLMIVQAPAANPVLNIQIAVPPAPVPIYIATVPVIQPTNKPSGKPSPMPTIDFFKVPSAPIPWWAPPPKPTKQSWEDLWPTVPKPTPPPSALFVETPSSWWIQTPTSSIDDSNSNVTMLPLQEFTIQLETSTGKMSTTTLTTALQDFLYNELIFSTLDNIILRVLDERTDIGSTAFTIITSTKYSGTAAFEPSAPLSSSSSSNIFDTIPSSDILYQEQNNVLKDIISLQSYVDKYFLLPGDNEDVVNVLGVTVNQSTNSSSTTTDDNTSAINTGVIVGSTAILALSMIGLGIYIIVRLKRRQLVHDAMINDAAGGGVHHGDHHTDKMALITTTNGRHDEDYGSETKVTKMSKTSGEPSGASMSSYGYGVSLSASDQNDDIITHNDEDHNVDNFISFGIMSSSVRHLANSGDNKNISNNHHYNVNHSNKKRPSVHSSKTHGSGPSSGVPTMIKTLSRTSNSSNGSSGNRDIMNIEEIDEGYASSKASTSSMNNIVTPASQMYAISISSSSSSSYQSGTSDDEFTTQTDEQPSTDCDIVTILRTDTDTVNTPFDDTNHITSNDKDKIKQQNQHSLPSPQTQSFDEYQQPHLVSMDPETQQQIQVQQKHNQQQRPSGVWGGRNDTVDF